MRSTPEEIEAKRQRLIELLSDPEPVWKSEDHPELKDGAAAWVHNMRQEDDRHRRSKLRSR